MTGRAPIIWEAGIDSGFYNYMYCNYTTAGTSWAPYQAWIIAFRPFLPIVDGLYYFDETTYCDVAFASGLLPATVTDEDILAAIERTKVEGTLMHVTILD